MDCVARSVVRLDGTSFRDSELKCGLRRPIWDPVPRFEPFEGCCCTCELLLGCGCGGWKLRRMYRV